MKKNNNKKVIVLLIVSALVIITGTSFALWQLTLSQTGTNQVTSGCFKVEYVNESDAITLNDAYPTSDEEGKKLAPYQFTIVNMCNKKASYYINLETLSSVDEPLDATYLKANLTTTDEEVFLDNLKDEHINQEKLISDSLVAYKLGEGSLEGKESKTYSLRLWLDEETPLIEEVMNKTYQAKITVLATNISLAKTMMKMDAVIDSANNTVTNNTYTQNGKYKLSKISFEDKITPLENISETVDFSQDKNRSVLGHYVKDENTDSYQLHIQSNGKIEINKDATAYFSYTPVNNESVVFEGIENIDTRNVENMSYMFYKYTGTTLDLSSFDTSKVTNMSHMFSLCRRLTNLDLGKFNTSKVTSMDGMFGGCNSITSLDLSGFDTSRVASMSEMFSGCNSLTNLNLENFNTSSVTNMSSIFEGCSGLTNLNLENFNTSAVTNMNSMFEGCSSLTNLSISKFNTRKVTRMNDMFYGCRSLTSLDLSGFDITYVEETFEMFAYCTNLTTSITARIQYSGASRGGKECFLRRLLLMGPR